jgi:quercetin dioxygenase-like cupin family protein
MNRVRVWISTVMVVCGGLLGTHLVRSQTDASNVRRGKDRARTLMSQALPVLEGAHLKSVLVEVRYGPGESSPPHSHPCAVVGYVVEGALRTQVQGEPEMIYKTGQSFYEPPNGVHLISANASTAKPAKLLAYFICDHDAALTIDVPEHTGSKGVSR